VVSDKEVFTILEAVVLPQLFSHLLTVKEIRIKLKLYEVSK
jgi:hypothetical protein